MAHGGGNSPYMAGYFTPERSLLMNTSNTEFVFLSCFSGNIEIPQGSSARMFGTGGKNTPSTVADLVNFIQFLGHPSTPIPQSALGFYELYNSFFYQRKFLMDGWSMLNLYLKENMLCESSESWSQDLTKASVSLQSVIDTAYVNSLPAQIWGHLMSYLPFSSNPWYQDVKNNLILGSKEGSLLTSENLTVDEAFPYIGCLASVVLPIVFAYTVSLSTFLLKYTCKTVIRNLPQN